MTVHTLKALKDNYIYILSKDGQAAVIDPGEAQPVIQYLDRHKLRLEKILCTHHHWDHVDGVAALVERYGCEVLCSEYDLPRVPHATMGLKSEQTLTVLGSETTVLGVPGHTLGQIAYYFPLQNALFAGDTLFSGGCGRLFEGTFQQMFESLGKIKSLPIDTQLYFGHEYTLNNIRFIKSRGVKDAFLDRYEEDCDKKLAHNMPVTPGLLATELKINPFLYAKDLNEFTQWRTARNTW